MYKGFNLVIKDFENRESDTLYRDEFENFPKELITIGIKWIDGDKERYTREECLKDGGKIKRVYQKNGELSVFDICDNGEHSKEIRVESMGEFIPCPKSLIKDLIKQLKRVKKAETQK